MDDVSLSSIGRLFQMAEGDSANALVPITACGKRAILEFDHASINCKEIIPIMVACTLYILVATTHGQLLFFL